MDPITAREKLNLFFDTLPDSVFFPLRDKELDPGLLTTDIASAHGFVIKETGTIVEGVRRVLAGEDSPSNFLSYIEQDPNIEEYDRPELHALAYEIQERIFDPVVPILKAAGLPVKEGRVPKPASSFQVSGSSQNEREAESQNGAASFPLEASSLKLEPSHVRALTRIAAGTDYSEGQLREAFENLPQGLQQAISSVDTANAIQDIAKKYLLHVDQMAKLASETGLVLLGLTHPADFIANLSRRLRLPQEKAREIARDLSSEILIKVREALRTLHEQPQATTTTKTERGTGVTPFVPHFSEKVGDISFSREGTEDVPKTATPFSPTAKWNTGDTILRRQLQPPVPPADGPLGGVRPTRRTLSEQRSVGQATDRGDASPVGPTGWRPPQSGIAAAGQAPMRGISSQVTLPKYPINKLESPVAKGNTPPADLPAEARLSDTVGQAASAQARDGSAPRTREDKTRPSETGTGTPQSKTPPPQDFLEQKMQEPVSLRKEEKRYTTDPYREPLDS